MHTDDLSHWQHDHTFGQERVRPGERRTLVVVAITALTVTLVGDDPVSAQEYRQAIPGELGVVHATIEVQRCPHREESALTTQTFSRRR